MVILANDPPVSGAQRRAMFAAANGKSALGIPKKVGEEFVGGKDENDQVPQAAGVVHVSPAGRVLLMHRSPDEANYGGHWGLPGGKGEEGETPEEAAHREVKEETGYDHKGAYKPLHRVATPNGMIFTTFAAPVDKEFHPKMADGEHTGFTWADLRHLPQPLHPQVAKVLGEHIGIGDDMAPSDWEKAGDNFSAWARSPVKGAKDGILTLMANDGAMDERLFAARRVKKDALALDRESVRSVDADGRLHVSITNISKATINPYLGKEIPDWEELSLDPSKVYKLLRDPQELKKAANTFNRIPLLSKHVEVSSADHDHAIVVGTTGSDAAFVDPYLRNSMTVWTDEAIQDVESGDKKELSCAYRYRADMTPGTFQGAPYDGVMRDIIGNHVALVEKGRAGPDVVVGDSHNREIYMTQVKLTAKGSVAAGALVSFLKPRLAKDAKLDLNLSTILGGVTAANFGERKPAIAKAVLAASKGKLAKDATLQDFHNLLNSVDDVSPTGSANGDAEGDVTDTSGMDEEDPKVAKMKEYLKDKMSEDEMAAMDEYCNKPRAEDEQDPDGESDVEAAEDEGETAEEKAAREKREAAADKKARDAKRAKDKAAKDKAAQDRAAAGGASDEPPPFNGRPTPGGGMDGAISKTAMDAALATQRKEIVAQMQATAAAVEHVLPYTGKLKVAFDSAEKVYEHAFKVIAEDISHLPKEARCVAVYKTLLDKIPVPSDDSVRGGEGGYAEDSGESVMGMDEDASTQFKNMFGDLDLSRIGNLGAAK